MTDLINTLPGNSTVNTVQHATIGEAVFSADPTDATLNWLDSDHLICVYCRFVSVPRLYWLIHKSMKHLKNSQQINYATDTKFYYTEIQIISPSLFAYSTDAQCIYLWLHGRIYTIIHFIPHACHITVDQSHSSSDTVAV
jgi:hypothetical protein